jgi:hypothetical protein
MRWSDHPLNCCCIWWTPRIKRCNAASLTAAAREVNRICYLARLAKDLQVINIEAHEFAAKTIDEIGHDRRLAQERAAGTGECNSEASGGLRLAAELLHARSLSFGTILTMLPNSAAF